MDDKTSALFYSIHFDCNATCTLQLKTVFITDTSSSAYGESDYRLDTEKAIDVRM